MQSAFYPERGKIFCRNVTHGVGTDVTGEAIFLKGTFIHQPFGHPGGPIERYDPQQCVMGVAPSVQVAHG